MQITLKTATRQGRAVARLVYNRRHLQHHIKEAALYEEQAASVQHDLDTREMTEREREWGLKLVNDLQAAAIDTRNARCLDRRHG